MASVRRSTRLSSISKASPTTTNNIWNRRQSSACVNLDSDDNVEEVECETDSENNENYNLINSSTRQRKPRTTQIKKDKAAMEPAAAATPKTPRVKKAMRAMPASKKREMLQKRKATQTSTRSTTDDSDENVAKASSDEEEEEASPPKQARRQRSSAVPAHVISPSRLLDRLSIDERQDAAAEETDPLAVETTAAEPSPTTPKSSPPKRNKYQNARRVLNSAETNFLPGREQELEQLHDYLSDHLNNNKSGSLYVSGQPGTGKTACLSKLLRSEEFSSKFTKVYINCTSISTIGSIYKKICAELQLKVQGRTEKDHLAAIRQLLTKQSRRKMILMVLDEVDQLCGQKQSVLYTIFEWPALVDSRLLLVGIANSLDLTDRLLMRLNASCDLKPRLMHFAPYTKQQIVDIFKSRLAEACVQDVFPPVTIQLLAAKVAAISGDVRRALDIGRRVVEIAEQQKRGTKGDLNLKDLGLATDDEELKPVQVTQVANVLNKVYGASQRLQEDMDESFPLQQKIMLCCLMLMLRKEKNKDITMGRLHDVYKRVCGKRNILAVDQAEFVGLVDLVETRGILRIIRKKEPRLGKVQLQWDEEEVNGALCDKQLIASILDDTACLSR